MSQTPNDLSEGRSWPRLTLILGGARSGKSAHALELVRVYALDARHASSAHAAGVPHGSSERSGSSGDAGAARVLFVATAEARDEEMRLRIAAHRTERPSSWITLEAPHDVGAAIARIVQPYDLLILDCVTLLASNVLLACGEEPSFAEAEAALMREVDALLEAWRHSAAPWIVISNEVGLGLVPTTPLGRVYRDALGRANRALAQAADEVLFMVAGLPLRVKG